MLKADQKLVFIGGLHRSGTSLLHTMLREHPLISGFHNTGVPEDEGQHLQAVYPPALAFGGPGKFCFDNHAHMDEHSPLATPPSRDALWGHWKGFWDTTKPILVEKSPPNLIRMRFLQALFPESYYIAVIRHPAMVAFATQKWSNTSIPSLLQHWQRAHSMFLKDSLHLKRLHIIRYEDLIHNPEGTLDLLYRFLGIAPYPTTHKVSAEIDKRYTVQWERYRLDHPIKARLAWLRTTLAKQFRYNTLGTL